MPVFVAQDFRLASGAVLRQIEIFFYGSTCAGSSNPATGQPRSESFPAVTMEDVVRAQGLLLDPLGTTRLHAVAGCSLGGFRAYQWAVTLPWVIATDTADHDSIDLGTAIPGLLQRFRDEPGWNDGKPAPAAMVVVTYLEIQSALGLHATTEEPWKWAATAKPFLDTHR
jgi:homoserine acetyltransferase